MKNKFLLFAAPALLVFTLLYSVGCQSIPEPVDYVVKRGGIYVTSIPIGAEIWVDGKNSFKITPDSVYDLESGVYNITLKHWGFLDTTHKFTVTKGSCVKDSNNIVPSQYIDTVGPATIYCFSMTGEPKSSGIVLSTGKAFNLTKKDSVDFFFGFDGKDSLFLSPNLFSEESVVHKRKSYFLKTSNKDLLDSTSVPKPYTSGDPDWTDRIIVATDYYFYVYDYDGHYSKIKVTKKNLTKSGDRPKFSGYFGLLQYDKRQPGF